MKDLTPLEAGRWLDAAPAAVQAALTSSATEHAVEDISKHYSLHVDDAGLLMKLVSYLLVGYITATEMEHELRGTGLTDKQIQETIAEVNQKIFMPLREKIESGRAREEVAEEQGPRARVEYPAPSAAPVVSEPEMLVMPSDMVPVQAPAPTTPDAPPPPPAYPEQRQSPKYIPVYKPGVYAPPPQSPSYQRQDTHESYIHHVTPVLHRATAKPAAPVAKPVATPAPAPQVNDSARLLEDREEPSPQFAQKSLRETLGSISRESQLREQKTLPVGEANTRPAPPTFGPLARASAASFPKPPAKPYTVDPYRESIDEKK